MTRPLRLQYEGSLWHITVRGNEKRTTFIDDTDRSRFLDYLGHCVTRFGWILSAYVLMTNHYHLLVELTASDTLSRGMHWLNTKYAGAFNKRHDRVGHLFQGRFKNFLIEKEAYLLEVLRYVVLNPVRAGIVARPEDYEWSSHRAILGQAPAPPWLAADNVLSSFGDERELARARYKHFVDDGIGNDRKPWGDLVGGMYLGREPWLQNVKDRVGERLRPRDHPRAQRSVGGPSMAAVLAAVAQALSVPEQRIRNGRGGTPRELAAWIGFNEARLTNSEIAAGLRIGSSGHVTNLIKSFERTAERDADLQIVLDHCLSTLRRKYSEPKA